MTGLDRAPDDGEFQLVEGAGDAPKEAEGRSEAGLDLDQFELGGVDPKLAVQEAEDAIDVLGAARSVRSRLVGEPVNPATLDHFLPFQDVVEPADEGFVEEVGAASASTGFLAGIRFGPSIGVPLGIGCRAVVDADEDRLDGAGTVGDGVLAAAGFADAALGIQLLDGRAALVGDLVARLDLGGGAGAFDEPLDDGLRIQGRGLGRGP